MKALTDREKMRLVVAYDLAKDAYYRTPTVKNDRKWESATRRLLAAILGRRPTKDEVDYVVDVPCL